MGARDFSCMIFSFCQQLTVVKSLSWTDACGFALEPKPKLCRRHRSTLSYARKNPLVTSVVDYRHQTSLIQLPFLFRKYLPLLKKYPPKYIYEPWTAPLSVQKAAGCVIGRDYPKPIVDHKVAMKTNIERMKKARAKQYGGTATDEGTVSTG